MRLALLSLLSLTLAGQEPALVPALTQVRMHPRQAWTTREAAWTFPQAGSQRLRLTGFPEGLGLDDLRVQVDGIPGLRLGSVSVTPEAAAEPPRSPEAAQVARTLRDLKMRLQIVEGTLGALLRLKPEAAAGASASLDPKADLEIARAVQAREASLLAEAQEVREQIATAEARRKALEEARAKSARPTSVVTVELDAPTAGEARVRLQSPASKAFWQPSYEVRLEDGGLQLLCFASMAQQSGEDWKGVRLEISNTEPGKALAAPVPPSPVKLLYQAPDVVLSGTLEGRITDMHGRVLAGAQVQATQDALKLTRSTVSDANGAFRIPLLPPGAYTLRATKTGHGATGITTRVTGGETTSVGLRMTPPVSGATVEVVAGGSVLDHTYTLSGTSIREEVMPSIPASYAGAGEFGGSWTLEGRRDLPADGAFHRQLLAKAGVQAQLRLRAVPRSSPDVHLTATLPTQAGFPWFPGTATAVFRDGEQLGQVKLPKLEGEGASFSFGPVPGLRVQRQRLEATLATAKGGRERQWTLRERVILVNGLDREAEVEVLEPAVRSGSDRLSVEALPDATPAETRGRLRVYKVKVPAHGQARIEEGWRITGPAAGAVPEVLELGLPTSD